MGDPTLWVLNYTLFYSGRLFASTKNVRVGCSCLPAKKHSSLSLKAVFSTKYILLRKSNTPLLDEEISTWDRIIGTVNRDRFVKKKKSFIFNETS
jgi:hypothetical protein